MEIVRARFDVIFDELARLPPLPVAVPVAAAHNQQRKCTAAWLYEHPGCSCTPSAQRAPRAAGTASWILDARISTLVSPGHELNSDAERKQRVYKLCGKSQY